MTVISIEEAQSRFSELLNNTPDGGEFIIMNGEKAVARLRVEPKASEKNLVSLGRCEVRFFIWRQILTLRLRILKSTANASAA